MTQRWIVDAMNVVGSRPDGWWKDRRGALVRLVDNLDAWALTQDGDVTVVFERPMRPPIESAVVTIAHAARAAPDSADDEIVRIVRAADHPERTTVVTSDVALADRVASAGASVRSAGEFRDLIDPR
jgi:uncharacterized protein YaiI (UPF0178 family)